MLLGTVAAIWVEELTVNVAAMAPRSTAREGSCVGRRSAAWAAPAVGRRPLGEDMVVRVGAHVSEQVGAALIARGVANGLAVATPAAARVAMSAAARMARALLGAL